MFVSWVGLSLIVFVLLRVLPGSFIESKLGVTAGATDQAEAQLEAEYGLDKPIPVQYVLWLKQLFSGGLGESFSSGQPVIKLIASRLPVTLELVSIAMILAIFMGIGLGIVSARRRGTIADHGSRVAALGGLSIPDFWQGTMVILGVAYLSNWTPPLVFPTLGEEPGTHIIAILIPAVPLATVMAAHIQRMTRSAMLEVLDQDYIRTARAKGLPERLVLWKHGLKNAAPVVLTVAGLQFGFLLSGAVGIEIVFSLPGIGRLILDSIQQRDYPVAQAAVLTVGVIFTLVNFFVNLLNSRLDPRIRERK